MLNPRSWMGLIVLAASADGCAQSPTTSDPTAVYRVQAATLAWSSSPGSSAGPSPVIKQPIAPSPRTSGGWGQRYPWRGPGERPAWYGVHSHKADSLVRMAAYYYPYYFEDNQIYPVYSMPFTLDGNRFTPHYGPLPPFGPAVVSPASAQLFQHHRGQLR